MNGHVSEEVLALYVSGDLPHDQNTVIGEHLSSCGQCRTSLSEFNQAQSLLTEAFREPVRDDLAELRQRITDRVRSRGSSQKQWIWWLSGAAAMVLLLFLGVHRPAEVVYRPPVNTAAHVTKPQNLVPALPEPHPSPRARAEMVRVKRRRVAPGIRSVVLITRADQPPVIRISTSDPNVIILWQSDEGTERK
jgi:hypothetical protein